jgi:osmotically-inducible protein OsmY
VVRAVADALAWDERTAPYVLRVDARHGVVTLRGEVPNDAIREAAADIAATVPSVGSVHNRIATGGLAQPAMVLARPSDKADEPNPEAAISVRA